MSAVAREPELSATQPPKKSGRVRWVAAAKGIGIILVVFGHVGRGVIDLDHGLAKQGIVATASAIQHYIAADSAIYAFHMALFFFLSGLFVERGAQKSALTFFGQKFQTIVYPYILWTMLQCLFVAAAAGSATSHASPREVFFKLPTEPFAQFWFLYTLMVCMTLFWLLYKLRLGRVGIMVVATIAYFFGALLHLSSWGGIFWAISEWSPLYQARMYFMFFAAGAWLAPYVLRPVSRVPAIVLALAGIALLALEFWLAADFNQSNLPGHLAHLNGIAEFARSRHLDPREWAAALPAIIGIAGTYCVSVAIAGRKWAALVEWLGEMSLSIYVAQVIAAAAARVALQKVLHVHSLPIHLIVGTLAGLSVPVVLELIAGRIGFRYLFTFGGQVAAASKTSTPRA